MLTRVQCGGIAEDGACLRQSWLHVGHVDICPCSSMPETPLTRTLPCSHVRGVGMTNGTTDVPDTVPGPRWKTWKAEASAGAHRLAFQVRSMLPATPRSSPGRPPCELGLCICPMPPTLGCFALFCPSHGLPWIGFMLQRMMFSHLQLFYPGR